MYNRICALCVENLKWMHKVIMELWHFLISCRIIPTGTLLRKRPLKLDKISVVDFPFPHTSVYYKRLSKESTSKTE